MPDSSGVVIESQPDYLRVSAHGADAAQNMLDLAMGVLEEERQRGNKVKPWRLLGYEGAHCGRVSYGQRDENSTILDLSGDGAKQYLAPALSLADAVTRLDLAVTWCSTPPDPYLGPNAHTLACQWWERDRRRAKPSTTNDAAGGYTFYLGARTSENFLRVYNKEAESIASQDKASAERYAGCWRYELEVKGPLAQNLAQTVDDQQDQASYIQNYLYTFCDQHGIPPAFPQLGKQALLPGFRRRSDDDVSIRHLGRNVRPTLSRLIEHGREKDALAALGLASSNPPLSLGGLPIGTGQRKIPGTGQVKHPYSRRRKDDTTETD